MKKNIWAILLPAILCLASCKKEIDNLDIYGVWMLTDPSEQPSGFTKLEFMCNPTEEQDEYIFKLWIDPVTNDTLYHYKSLQIKGDSLLLTDDNGTTYSSIIGELHDSVLVLSDINGTGQKAMYKRIAKNIKSLGKDTESENTTQSYFDSQFALSPKNYPSDSLDVVLRSTYIQQNFREYNEAEEKFINYPYHALTKTELKKAHNLLKDYMDHKLYLKKYASWTNAYPFDGYFRQYYSCIKNKHVIVYVGLSHDFYCSKWEGYTALKKDFQLVKDGWVGFGEATIDLTTGKILAFSFHGTS